MVLYAKTAKANHLPAYGEDWLSMSHVLTHPSNLTICYSTSNGGKILKIGEYLIILLYHGSNQKAKDWFG